MSTASHLEKLNGAQRKAVTHGEPIAPRGFKAAPMAVIAGAGTGKTEVLAHGSPIWRSTAWIPREFSSSLSPVEPP